MTSEQYLLEGAYASLAPNDGIALYGSAESLQNLAGIIRLGAPTVIDLSLPPDEVVEVNPLGGLRLLPADGELLELRVVGDVIEVVGGRVALSKLAATLEGLADAPEFGGLVPRHVDLEYFPGHGFLGEGSTWMTVTLLTVLGP